MPTQNYREAERFCPYRLSTVKQIFEVANRPDVEVRITFWKAGPRKVKIIILKQGGKEYPVPKGQLGRSLYPPRKTVNHAPPEKKHAGVVRAAMRQYVDYQLQRLSQDTKIPCDLLPYGSYHQGGNAFGH